MTITPIEITTPVRRIVADHPMEIRTQTDDPGQIKMQPNRITPPMIA